MNPLEARRMSTTEARSLAALLKVKPKKGGAFSTLDLADAVSRGLGVETVDVVCNLVAPGDATLRHRIVPKATLARRRRAAGRRLSPDESERVARLARVWAFALDVWKSPAAAQRFLSQPHMLLRGRIPRELAAETEIGARAVENILGGLKYGTAV
jgi:putative toxin-antitoxin system antitoxin component (TIGR02293 family)